MKRIIVDYKKLSQNILDLLVEKYPDGYNDSDIIQFRNAKGELIEAVEVRTEDTAYLVKVSVKLEERMENFMDDEDDDENDGFKKKKVKAEDRVDFYNDDLSED